MKRRAFLLNSAVLLLLIPLLLLLATYEDVSSQIVQSQSIRMQAEKTYRIVSYLEMDFQKALGISGKRAIITVIDYVSVTGNFIPPTYMANNTIRDLILDGTSPSLVGYNPDKIMGGQTLKGWILNISADLRDQGFEIRPSIDEILNSMQLTIAPLDSFRVVVKARIPNVTIQDISGRVVYTGPIPSSGRYIYSIVDIQDLEDPLFSAMTGGMYYRSIRACPYSLPELLNKPVKVLEGNGTSTVDHFVEHFSRSVDSTKIYFGDYYPGRGAAAYVLLNDPGQNVTVPIVFNTTLNGVKTSPLEVFNKDDMGVLVFESANTSSETKTTWCSLFEYRLNVTIQNRVNQELKNFQVPVTIDSTTLPNPALTKFFRTADSDRDNIPIIEFYDENCNPINFWVEKWDTNTKQAVIWVNVTIPANSWITLSMYFGSTGRETLGNPNKVFDFYDDFSGTLLNTTKWTTNTDQYSIENGYIKMWGNWNNRYYLNTLKGFAPNVIIEGVWRLGGYFFYDTDLTIGLVPTETTPWLSNSAIYAWYDGYGGVWWIGPYDEKSLRIYGRYLARGGPIYSTDWQSFKIIYTGRWIRFWDSYTDNWLTALVFPPLTRFHLQIAADTDSVARYGYVDWIRIRKYVAIPPVVTVSNQIDQKPVQNIQIQTTMARAYDIQPFIDCIMDQRYFGIYDAPSFFERVEGNTTNHATYEALANQMQDELGVKYGNQYYPIGLVSFMIPDPTYDSKLFDLFNILGLSIEEGQTSFDYYFLQYYFRGGTKVNGYRVWGVSQGVTAQGDLSSVPFFLDNQTAIAIFGTQGAQDLLQR